MNLPEDYQNKMQKMLGGDEYLQYLDSFNYSYGQTLRVNQLKKEPADFIRRAGNRRRSDSPFSSSA